MEANPFTTNEGENPKKFEDAYWGSKQEDVLFDAYLMLSAAGYSNEELEPLGLMIERTTIYDRDDLQRHIDSWAEADSE